MATEVIEGLEVLLMNMKRDGKRIAVVGNAVFKKPYGDEINKYDEIIRFNNFLLKEYGGRENTIVLKDYTPYVGHRTTWWCTHPYISAYFHRFNASMCHRKYDFYKVDGRVYIPKHDYWQEYRDKYHKILSSGMTMLLIMDKLKVHADVFGFDNFKTGHYWDPDHKRSEQHQPFYEMEIQEKLTYMNFME